MIDRIFTVGIFIFDRELVFESFYASGNKKVDLNYV